MPWLETEPMNEKVKFIIASLNNEESSFQALCERFNISRKTGYKYVKRFELEGFDGLKDRSRAPLCQANKMPLYIEECILDLKAQRPTWGSKKIRSWLIQEKSEGNWPAKSTIDELFKRHHLVIPSKRKRRIVPYTDPFVLCDNPNDSWSMDYKGQFILGNQQWCYPLTITDNFSRCLLAAEGAHQISGAQVKRVLTRLFLEVGMPLAIRSDNGSPFASTGLGGLSQLAVWLIKLNIIPERIRCGHPEQNGRHERMHLTLKKETALPPQWDLLKQQQKFDEFKLVFNEHRPHEGIEFNRPAWLYRASSRSFPSKIPSVEYDSTYENTRKIRNNGTMKWRSREIHVSETLVKETIAMRPYSSHEWLLYFSFMPIGIFDEKTLKVRKLC